MPQRTHRLLAVVALSAFLAAALAVVLTLRPASNDANAQDRGATEINVRVAARSLDDGRVEVAVQPPRDDGWSDLLAPKRRFLRADAEVDMWFFSSPVALPAAEMPIVCMVTHGRADDFFWARLLNVARRLSADLNLDLHIEQHPDPIAQAAAVRSCAADGAEAIASTLAAPDVLAPALLEASHEDIQIFTFNSGAEHASSVGSIAHVALNEGEAGRLAGSAFNDLGIGGVVVCVLHEEQNISLIERCDGLTSVYAGTVDVVQLDEFLTASERAAAIAGRLSSSRVDGILTLNSDTAIAALEAIHGTGSSALLGSVGINPAQLLRLESDLAAPFAFAISNGATRQALYTIVSVYNRLGRRAVVREEVLPEAPTLVYIAPGLLSGVAELLQDERLRSGLLEDR